MIAQLANGIIMAMDAGDLYLQRPAPVNGKMRLLRGNFSSLKYIQTKIDYAERDGDGWRLNLLSIAGDVLRRLMAALDEREDRHRQETEEMRRCFGDIRPASLLIHRAVKVSLEIRERQLKDAELRRQITEAEAYPRPVEVVERQGRIAALDHPFVREFGIWRAVTGAILIRHCDSDTEIRAALEAAAAMLAAQGGGGTVACIGLPPIVDGVIRSETGLCCRVGNYPELRHLGRGYDVVFMPEVKHRRAGLLRKDRDSLRAIVRAARADDSDFDSDLATVRSRGQRANLIAEKLHTHTSYNSRRDLARALRNQPVLLEDLCVHTKK